MSRFEHFYAFLCSHKSAIEEQNKSPEVLKFCESSKDKMPLHKHVEQMHQFVLSMSNWAVDRAGSWTESFRF